MSAASFDDLHDGSTRGAGLTPEKLRLWPSRKLLEAIRYYSTDYPREEQRSIKTEIVRRALPIPEAEAPPDVLVGEDLNDVTLGGAFSVAVAGFFRRMGLCAGAMLVAIGVFAVCGLALAVVVGPFALGRFAGTPSLMERVAVRALFMGVVVLLQLLVCYGTLGVARVCVAVARREQVSLARAFSPRGRFLHVALVWCLVSCVVAPVSAGLDLLGDGVWAYVGWALPVAVQYVLFPLVLFVADRGLSPFAALGAFQVASRGYRLRFLGFAALSALPLLGYPAALVFAAGSLTFLVPLSTAPLLLLGYVPLIGIGLAALYSSASGEEAAAERARRDGPHDFKPVWLPGQAGSVRLERVALLLLLPTCAFSGRAGWQLVTELVKSVTWSEAWMGLALVGGLAGVPFAIGAVLLYLAHSRQRAVVIDTHGVLLDCGARWPGTRLPWTRLSGFRITSHGIQLRLAGRPWTRWLGPMLPCQERQIHDLVVLLEQRGVMRF